ncbi:MAG: ATP-binding protein [Nannocystaceae bacterium]
MLLQFAVENVLSFRDQAVLSLLAAPGVEHQPRQVIEVEGLPTPVLRVAALYGANASGKSNLVQALAMVRRLILHGTHPGQRVPIEPFKLDPRPMLEPSHVELELYAEGRRWSYGFEWTHHRVESEWLFVHHDGVEQPVFRRWAEDDGGQVHIEVDESFVVDDERRRFWRFVAEGTRPNQLFVTEARDRNIGELGPLLSAVDEGLVTVAAGEEAKDLRLRLEQDAELLAFASDLLRESGTGVSRVEVVRGARVQAGDEVELGDGVEQWLQVRSSRRRLVFSHEAPSGASGVSSGAKLEEHEESDGTRRLVGLAPPVFSLLHADTSVFVDELDRSLHTLLSRHLIERFLATDPASSGQLVFTTHDTNLLDLGLLPRDSVWFVEKDGGGGSTLYSLSEFKPEQLAELGNRVEQGYLNGRFGGIPFLGDPRRLGWTKIKAS